MSLKDTNQNVQTPVPEIMRQNKWTYGLCGCFNDCNIAMKACCCLPCTIAGTSAALDNNPEPCLCCYPGMFHYPTRLSHLVFAVRILTSRCYVILFMQVMVGRTACRPRHSLASNLPAASATC